jgi:hypothetical protein
MKKNQIFSRLRGFTIWAPVRRAEPNFRSDSDMNSLPILVILGSRVSELHGYWGFLFQIYLAIANLLSITPCRHLIVTSKNSYAVLVWPDLNPTISYWLIDLDLVDLSVITATRCPAIDNKSFWWYRTELVSCRDYFTWTDYITMSSLMEPLDASRYGDLTVKI